jgi:dihydroneopterin aldolase
MPSDRIEIRGLRAFGRHGVFEQERRDGQTFVIDAVLELDLAPAASSDALSDTVDYGTLAARLAEAVGATRFDLIEALAGRLCDLALDAPGVHAATVRVAKPDAPVDVDLDDVAVVVRRTRP